MFYSFHGKCPRVDPTAFVSTSAELIGDVTVGRFRVSDTKAGSVCL